MAEKKEKEVNLLSDKELEVYTKQGTPIEIVKSYYEKFLEDNKDWLTDPDEFVDDEDRKGALEMHLHREFLSKSPVKPYSFIPIGMEPVKTSKSKKIYSALHVVMAKRSGDFSISRLGINGTDCDLLKKVSLWHKYDDVPLSKSQKGDDFIMDGRAGEALDHPTKVTATPKQIIDKLNLDRVPNLSQLKNFVSKKGSDGWTIKTDLRIVRGMIAYNPWINDEDPYNEGGNYKINDTSMSSVNPIVTPSGETLPPVITAWMSPKMMLHDEGDIVDLITTVEEVVDGKTKKKTGEIQLNAICEIPIHVLPNRDAGDDKE